MSDTQITETAQAAEQIGTIATDIANVQTAVSAFSRIKAGLQAIREAYPPDVIVGDIQTTKGMAVAVAARAAWRDPRIAVEKVRKDAKAPLLALGKSIDSFAQQLTEQLLVGEKHYDAQIKTEEARKAAEKAEAERIEAERVGGLQKRLDALRNTSTMATGQKAGTIAAVLADVQAVAIDDTWEEFKDRAEVAKRLTVMALQNMLTSAQAAEAEAARLAAERAEQARVAAEQARVAAELEARLKALADQEAELARQRAAMEEEQNAARLAKAEAQMKQASADLHAQREVDMAEQRAAMEAAEAARLKDEQDREDARRRALDLQQQAEVAPAPIPMQPVEPVQILSRDADGFTAVISPAAECVDPAPQDGQVGIGRVKPAPVTADEPSTLPLGKICARLGFTMTADFVATKLGIKHRATDKAAKLYSEADFGRICQALISHIRMAESLAG